MLWLDEILDAKSTERGKRRLVVSLKSDTVPSTFPATGEDVEGLVSTDTIEKGSYIYVIGNTSLYMKDSSGNWIQQ